MMMTFKLDLHFLKEIPALARPQKISIEVLSSLCFGFL